MLGEVSYLRDEADTVIVGGSLAYGCGNGLSDLDLIITGPMTVESSRVPIEIFIGSLRVDVWKLARGLIEDTFDRAERALADDAALLGSFGDTHFDDELKLMHRIAFGIVIDGDANGLRQAREYGAVASDLAVREYVERMRASALLAQLALEAGQTLAAVINARLAVEEGLGAAVAYRRLPFSGDKWLGERLAGEASDLAHVYEPFRRLPGSPPAEAAQFVHAAVAACVEMWGLELGIAALAPLARWVNTGLRAMEIGDDRLLVSSLDAGLWRLEENEIEIWRQLASSDGVQPDAAWSRDVASAESSFCLQLHEHGLLELRWASGIAVDGLRPSVKIEK